MSDPNDVGDRDDVGGEAVDSAGGDEVDDEAVESADGDEVGGEAVESADGDDVDYEAVDEDRLAALAEEIDDEDGEWRFGLDEVGEDAESVREPIEPESISLEHVAFVLAGVIGTLALLFLGI